MAERRPEVGSEMRAWHLFVLLASTPLQGLTLQHTMLVDIKDLQGKSGLIAIDSILYGFFIALACLDMLGELAKLKKRLEALEERVNELEKRRSK
jgi:hypothetical protein